MVPKGIDTALDVGARDGHLSRLLAQRATEVVALDLEPPSFQFDRVRCVAGNATHLQFSDRTFDLVFCAEVLEHIADVDAAARELARVSRRYILVGVPYKQDVRIGRLTCSHCNQVSPPWGHLHSFDEAKLAALFPDYVCNEVSWVGTTRSSSNPLAVALLDYAGNPFANYQQDEPCVHCLKNFSRAPSRTFTQKVASALGVYLQRASTAMSAPHGNWIHMLLERR